MTGLNPAFPVYSRETLINSPREISNALLKKGVCYITGFQDVFDKVSEDFDSLNLNPDGNVKILAPSTAKSAHPAIYSVLFAPEFKAIKRQVLGMLYKDEIEIFCQYTGPSKAPPSGALHFDKRYTLKSWYYLNDLGPEEGPMRVVPLDCCEKHSPIALRAQLGSRSLFQGGRTQHEASEDDLKTLEPAAEFITGPKGTVFLHITEAWHGASPVMTGSERKILRAHSRAFSDFFLR
jgi:hypothetical protein